MEPLTVSQMATAASTAAAGHGALAASQMPTAALSEQWGMAPQAVSPDWPQLHPLQQGGMVPLAVSQVAQLHPASWGAPAGPT